MGGSELQSYVGYLGLGLAVVGIVGLGGIGMLFFTVTGAPLLCLEVEPKAARFSVQTSKYLQGSKSDR